MYYCRPSSLLPINLPRLWEKKIKKKKKAEGGGDAGETVIYLNPDHSLPQFPVAF